MSGRENRKFMLVVLLSFFFVLLGTVISTLAYSVSAISRNADTSIEQYRELVRESIENELYDFARLLRNPGVKEILAKGSGGDEQALAIALFNMLEIALGEPYYLILVRDGRVVDSKLPGEIGKEIPPDVYMQGARAMEEFRGKRGDLLMAGAPLGEDLGAAVVVDITREIEEARKPFDEQKSDVLWVSLFIFLGFLILAVLVAVFAIGKANSRYISGPIKDLEDKAKRMMEGETGIAVSVDEHSDYYALQALLDGMRRMLEEMESRSTQ